MPSHDRTSAQSDVGGSDDVDAAETSREGASRFGAIVRIDDSDHPERAVFRCLTSMVAPSGNPHDAHSASGCAHITRPPIGLRGCSERPVRCYRNQALSRLGVRPRTEPARRARARSTFPVHATEQAPQPDAPRSARYNGRDKARRLGAMRSAG